MIINCPQCNARFLVADANIPPAGRMVRCGNCAHQWHVSRPLTDDEISSLVTPELPIEEPPPETKPLEQGANVPALSKRKIPVRPFKIAAPILAAVWMVLAFLTYFPKWIDAPVVSSIYSMLGVHQTQGLVFANVHMEREDGDDSKTKFIFTGSITNQSSSTRMVPEVYVSLKDKDNKVIWGRTYPVNVELKAGEVYPFRIVNVETSFADKVSTIVLDLGNSFELMVR